MLKRIVRTLFGTFVILCLSVSLAQAQSTALWLVTDNTDHTELAIHPIDPVSLQDIPDRLPFSMGHHYVSALSPDRKTLAAIVWPTQYSAEGTLHLIDLTTWEDHQTDTTIDEYVSSIMFSPDGNTLYWIAPAKAAKTHPLQAGFGVFACDITHCNSTNLLTALGDDFSPEQAMLIQSGSHVAVYGIPTEANGTAKDVPQIILIDLLQKQITSTIRLEGLKTGLLSVENLQVPFEYNHPGLAWDIEANLLYIAHSTADHFTVVNLAQGTSQELTISSGKGVGNAKGVLPGIDHLATVRGGRLLVSSFRRQVTSTENGTFHILMQPLGIQQIDTEQMQLVNQLKLPLFEMSASPDGLFLLATGVETEIPPDGGDWKVTGSGLYILDATNLVSVKYFPLSRETTYLQGFSVDSQYAYVTSFNTTINSSPLTLRVIDLSSMTIAAERILPSGYSALLGTLNAAP